MSGANKSLRSYPNMVSPVHTQSDINKHHLQRRWGNWLMYLVFVGGGRGWKIKSRPWEGGVHTWAEITWYWYSSICLVGVEVYLPVIGFLMSFFCNLSKKSELWKLLIRSKGRSEFSNRSTSSGSNTKDSSSVSGIVLAELSGF